MPANYKAAVTVITVSTEKGDYVVLGAQDPRWRIDKDGKFDGIDAVDAQGNLVKLPLQPGFVGGKIEGRKKAKDAALREIKEETGLAFATLVDKAGLRPIYIAEPKQNKDAPHTEYFHAHLSMRYAALQHSLRVGDDTVALMLVKPEQIVFEKDRGFVIKGEPESVTWRGFLPIKMPFFASPKQREIITKYNANGASVPRIGIDESSLNNTPQMYTPPGCAQDAPLSDAEIAAKKGPHASNGTIFTKIVQPRLAQLHEHGASTGAALAM